MNRKKSLNLNKKIYKSKIKPKFNISSYLLKLKKVVLKIQKKN